ncbi:MAG: ral secretion pathway protein [Moraxellaceae bacterium]|jgi:general secretion pathway protein K|nr:ral secretion pathway protein [Moraxellaceae bacterium]
MGGVALLTVLVIVAIATVLCVGMLRGQRQSLQHAAGLFHQDQAWLYTQGAENFVRDLLKEDLKSDKRRNKQVDHPGEAWAQPFPPFPVEGGMVRARVEDLQGRFNLNRLGEEDSSDGPASTIFRQLLRNLGLPDALAPAVSDWVDADDTPRDGEGAEDDFYSRLPEPYRVANQPITDISELRLVRGFTPQVIAKLRPHVTALPPQAMLNVNTAGATVISALLPALTPSAARDLDAQRPKDGYPSLDDFLSQPVFNGLGSDEKDRLRQQLDVRSQYFLLLADADIGGRHSMVHAVLVRGDSGTLRVVSRDLGQKVAMAASVPGNSGSQGTGAANQDQESLR